MSSPLPASLRWTVVLPVKTAKGAKSRLVAPVGVDHDRLARAIALDALEAVRGGALVAHRVVVTSDPVVGPAATAAGDHVVPDAGRGLGAAVATGVAVAGRLTPEAAVAVLLPDLPALTPRDVDTAFGTAGEHATAFVPDVEGTGTVLLTAMRRQLMRPAFGNGSAARHSRLGAVRLELDLPRLRRDVDTLEGLRAAAALGLGAETTAALGPAGASEDRSRAGLGAPQRLRLASLMPVQASVHEFDPATAAGSVLLDDGRQLFFSPEAFGRSRLRLLRPGQRVTIDVEDGAIVAVRIVGIDRADDAAQTGS